MLIDRKNLARHRNWILYCLTFLAAMAVWYTLAALAAGELPGGASLVGFTSGVLGGLIILFECFLWFRKRYFRAWHIGRTQTWLRAHIWLGLLSVPLLVLHSGFRWGGMLSTVLMVVLLVVVASGIWGLVLQRVLPRRLLDEVSGETVYHEMENLVGQLAVEAERLILVTCGGADSKVEPAKGAEAKEDKEEKETGPGYVSVGAVRAAARIKEARPAGPFPDTEPLRDFFRATLEPYLRRGETSDSPLRYPDRAAALFAGLRERLPAAAHPATVTLEELCAQRRLLDFQARLHFWLHSWLCIHLPLSGSLLFLMVVHIIVALRYW